MTPMPEVGDFSNDGHYSFEDGSDVKEMPRSKTR